MRASSKILLDRFLGRPMAFFLNLIVWPLGRLFPRNHDDSPQSVKTIVLAKFLGMGSILRATPLVRALRQKYPHAHYVFVTTHKNRCLIEHLPFFDEGLYVRDSSLFTIFIDTFRLLIRLWQLKVDLYFDLEVYSALSTILTTLSLARNRYGFYRASTRFRSGLNTCLVYFNDYQHISKIYLQIARACGIAAFDYKIEKIHIHEQDYAELSAWMSKNLLAEGQPYIVVNPNASELLLERRWPKDYFISLLDGLSLHWKGFIFLVGSLDEYGYVQELYNALSLQAKRLTFNTCGKLSLGAVMALIEKAKLMVTNDSGLYHVAVSFAIPVISLWGPGIPEHYADIKGINTVIFYCREVYCSPCLYQTDFPPCRGNNICMKSISPVEVYKKACEMLGLSCDTEVSTIMEDTYRAQQIKDFDIIIRTATGRQ